MIELFWGLLGLAAILAAAVVFVVLFVALVAVIDGAKEVMMKRKEDDHGT